ncbi:unnamed protein product [Caenorhabditis bovis]|uniref:Uncharacterized protein n=1 Tax=Caenorhabditis bovis TaxID=2654633 RepID=A0A8S1FEW4_9PELO|nr:unnamed protein product [Caenorhabditis bovis]
MRNNTTCHRLCAVAAILILFTKYAQTLDCMQCGNTGEWYSEEAHEKHINACRHGLIAPTRCENASHTHCIVSWYRTGGSSEKIVTQRQCGTKDDVTGCTLYNSKISRRVRHLLNRDDGTKNLRKETVASFVEVCSTSCPNGECVNTSNSIPYILTPLISLILSQF